MYSHGSCSFWILYSLFNALNVRRIGQKRQLDKYNVLMYHHCGRAHTHARTHARTQARTHARTLTHTQWLFSRETHAKIMRRSFESSLLSV